MVDAPLCRDQREKVAGERRDLEPGRDLSRGGALGRGRDPGTREEGAQLGLAGEQIQDDAEVTRDGVHLITLPGELEERLRVGAADARRGLHLVADFRDRVGDDAPVVLVAQAPAYELLRDRRGELGDLAPELVTRSPNVSVHLRLRGLDEPL